MLHTTAVKINKKEQITVFQFVNQNGNKTDENKLEQLFETS